MAKRRRAAAAARKPRKAKASSSRFPKASPYLKKLSTAVRRHFSQAVDLPTFLSSAGQLTAEDRTLIVRVAPAPSRSLRRSLLTGVAAFFSDRFKQPPLEREHRR